VAATGSSQMMVEFERVHTELRKRWEGSLYYPSIDSLRIEAVTKYMCVFRDKDVVDIGCNAGLLTYVLAQYARSYCGVETNEDYYKQALVTQKYITAQGIFVHSPLTRFIKHASGKYHYEYNAMFAANVLYHLSEKTLCMMQEVMLPKCDVVLCTSREDKLERVGPRLFEHHNNLYHWCNIRSFLRTAGMKVEVRDKSSNWVSVVGWRR